MQQENGKPKGTRAHKPQEVRAVGRDIYGAIVEMDFSPAQIRSTTVQSNNWTDWSEIPWAEF